MSNFFFINTYDGMSGSILAKTLNQHDDIFCTAAIPIFDMSFSAISSFNYENIKVDKLISTYRSKDKKISGLSQRFTTYQLHHKTLSEKTISPFKSITLTMPPQIRINLLLHAWTHEASHSLNYINKLIEKLSENKSFLFSLNNFDYFKKIVFNSAKKFTHIDFDNPNNEIFLLALALTLTHDTADLPAPHKIISLEQLAYDSTTMGELIQFVSCKTIANDYAVNAQLQLDLKNNLNRISSSFSKWENWQIELTENLINKKLHTIYHPHINKSLNQLYSELSIIKNKDSSSKKYSKLISIHLNSNRPAQIFNLLENIEETTENLSNVEVVINIDNDDIAMEQLLNKEISTRNFDIKYVKTPRPKEFCDLWKPLNEILKATSPRAYFLVNISDEMLFLTQGWDTILEKYVGFFPDDLFRLRASRNKLRNYFDRWECSFAQDSIPITTKRWVDIGGDWNPCFGPDSFQQLVSFYLNKEGKYSNYHFQRDVPIFDIKFMGDTPSIGIDQEKNWKHAKNHADAMLICQSKIMQEEAKRRALLIKAYIISEENQSFHTNVECDSNRKCINIFNIENEQKILIYKFDYALNWFTITFSNNIRKLFFHAHFGDGGGCNTNPFKGFYRYLKMQYLFFCRIEKIRKNKILNLLKKIQNATLIKILSRLMRKRQNSLKIEHEKLKELYFSLSVELEKIKNSIYSSEIRKKESSL